MIGGNHQAGRKLEVSESICSLQSKDSIKVENNKEKTKINEFQMVCFLNPGSKWESHKMLLISSLGTLVCSLLPRKQRNTEQNITLCTEFCAVFINWNLSVFCLEPFMTSPTIVKEIKTKLENFSR